ncbi:hypothetical protein N7445_009047 [Penicillium cf. griseofulvum]|nr:hypothetical protein N7445_009047 [Penicillium cf. griseofulvum]
MSAYHTPVQDYMRGAITPPPIPAKTLLLVHQLPELDDQELQEFLDRAIRDGCDIHHFYRAMVDAIRSNRACLVKELLRCKIPISRIYILEAIMAKAKDILTVFFDSGWDINKPLSIMEPPMLVNALEDLEMAIWLLDRGADPNTRCDIDNTPLSYAVRYAGLPTIDLLLRRGGDVRIGQLIYNAIYRECDNDTRQDEIICYLIHKGASVKIEDHRGQTVIQSADEDTRRVILQEIQNSTSL